jgi:hypothetical protein
MLRSVILRMYKVSSFYFLHFFAGADFTPHAAAHAGANAPAHFTPHAAAHAGADFTPHAAAHAGANATSHSAAHFAAHVVAIAAAHAASVIGNPFLRARLGDFIQQPSMPKYATLACLFTQFNHHLTLKPTSLRLNLPSLGYIF